MTGSSIPSLQTIDRLNASYLGGDSTYLYGIAQGSRYVTRYDIVAGTETNIFDVQTIGASMVLNRVHSPSPSTDGLIFITFYDSTTHCYFMQRSTNANVAVVDDIIFGDEVKLGWDADGWVSNSNTPIHIPGVSILGGWGLREVTINSQKVFLRGDYNLANVYNTRVDGADYDQVNIYKSIDTGATWTLVISFNTDGSNHNIRHVHAFNQPGGANTDIYITFGDDGDEMGILRWNGTSSISSKGNHDPSWYGTTAENVTYAADGLSSGIAYGANRYRTGDIVSLGDYLYWSCDFVSGAATELGIWKAPLDLSTEATRVDSTATEAAYSGYAMFGMIKTSNNILIAHFSPNAGITELRAPVLVSTDGTTWGNVGTIGYRSDVPTILVYTFEKAGKIYVAGGSSAFAGPGNGNTIVLQESSTYTLPSHGIAPILSPVYFVAASGGNNSNSGYSVTKAWATIKYALQNGVGQGTRVVLSSGTHDTTETGAGWTMTLSVDIPDITSGPTIIEGAGKDVTYITGTTSDKLIWWGSGASLALRTILKDFTIFTATVAKFSSNVPANKYVDTYNVAFGNRSNGSHSLSIAGNLRMFAGTEARAIPNNGDSLNCYFAAGGKVYCEFSLIDGGARGVTYLGNGSTLTLYNCTVVNYYTAGIRCDAGAGLPVPVVKNTIFYSTQAGAKSILDNASLTETGELDYNIYFTANTNIADTGSHSLAVGTDPGFVNAATGDFRLKNGSLAIAKGIDLFSTIGRIDYLGNTCLTPDIGAICHQPKGSGNKFGF